MILSVAAFVKGRPTFPFYLGGAIFFVGATLLRPTLLGPLNILWYRFGLILHKMMNPIILGILYFVIITPFGMVLRLFSYDALKLKKKKSLKTYWIDRNPPGPKPESLSEQF